MLFLFVMFIGCVHLTWAEASFYWDLSRKNRIIKSDQVDYVVFTDSTGRLKLADILQDGIQQNFTSIKRIPDERLNEAHHWVKLPFKNGERADRWVLEVQSLHTPVVELYFKNSKGQFEKKTAGHALPFFQKDDYKVKNIVFELPFYTTGETEAYIHIKSKGVRNFYFHVKQTASLIEYTVNEYLLLGMYYGILLIIAVYNLALYITTKETIHLLYVPYILSCILSSLTEDGLGFAYLWPAYPYLNILINYAVAPLFFMGSFVLYSRRFLDLNTYYRKLDQLLIAVTLLYFLCWSISQYYTWWTKMTPIVYVVPFVSLYMISIYAYWKGFKPARYYIMAYSLICLAILIGVLRLNGFFPPSVWIVYSFNIGLIAEACVMSYAIGDKVRIITEQQKTIQNKFITELERNNELQNKVNKELEDKVSERTAELNKANQSLEALSAELQMINSKLDYDNWHLKQKIVEEKRESVLSKVVTFQDFQIRFPNEYTCQSYIESIKWQGDFFKCKKCEHEKYNTPKGTLSRKCTRCDHVESVTSDTLFHGIRFPLVKAFYIIHVVVNDIKDMNIEELAHTLGLAKNTCWKFRKKVEERLKELKKKQIKVSSWDVLIK